MTSIQRITALRQRGFTLVELMISMVIGLFIVLALLTLLINVNRNNSELTKTNRVIENGRFALQLLEADVEHAGFWGGFLPQYENLAYTGVPSDVPATVPDPCPDTWTGATASTFTTATYVTGLIGTPVQSYEIPAVVPSPTLSVCGARVVNPQPSTDVLFVRRVDNESCVAGAAGCPASPGEPYFQINSCFDSTSPGYSTLSYAFATDTSAFLSLYQGSCTPTTPFVAGSAGTRAALRKYISNMYYVRDYAVTAGDGVPTLMRSQFGLSGGALGYKAAEALIEGIQGFRVELGVDTVSATGAAINLGQAIAFPNPSRLIRPSNRGDGFPDGAYVHCTTALPCTASQLTNTVAVKIYVLVRSENKTPGWVDDKTYTLGSTTLGPFNDQYKRHLFTQTIRLTNVSMRRETPTT